jgi:beta-lactam-binding protein with PASTA domain
MRGIARDTMVDGRYRAEKRLGSGGMAEVWCAEDEVLGRRVALKLLGSRFAEDDEFRERFRREAQAAAGLAHPNIVGIFDRSEWDGTPYIAMELVDGRTLKDLVRERGPLPPGMAVDLTIQVLRALAYAHRRGIVHRDVKPQNVILDDEGQAKVADFGIARAGASEMTQTGAIVGTVQYLSPEQAQGHPVDARSDLYSVGVMLYELLTGQVPFDAESPVSIALKQVSEPPVPLSQLEPAIPAALEAVVLRALEKDPAQRFQTAEEFIAALEASRRAPAVAAPAEAWVEEDEPRSRWWLWLLALLAVLALAAAAYFLTAGKKVEVPDVVGRTASDAAATLHQRELEVAFRSVVSEKVKRDHVISQDPQGGAQVKKHTTVQVTISAGRGSAPVPEVQGLKQAAAEEALRKAGFNVKVAKQYSDDVPAGTVISSSPAQGQTLERGKTVTLTVSRGPQGVEVPKLTGLQQDAAEQQLSGAGLRADVTQKESDEAAGTVLSQDPQPGTKVAKNSTVELTVAKQKPAVPDVSSDHPTLQDAQSTLEQAGFKSRTRDQAASSPGEVGHVIRQYPEPGTRRSSGATVTLVVGVEATPTPTPTPTATPTPTPTPTATP